MDTPKSLFDTIGRGGKLSSTEILEMNIAIIEKNKLKELQAKVGLDEPITSAEDLELFMREKAAETVKKRLTWRERLALWLSRI